MWNVTWRLGKEYAEMYIEKGIEKGIEMVLTKIIRSMRESHISEDTILDELTEVYDLSETDAKKLLASVK